MATVGTASASSREKVSIQHLESLAGSIGVTLPQEHLEEWRNLVAATQDSMDAVDALPDYVPQVDLTRFPRQDVHRPPPNENPGNAWAWKARIQGSAGGPLAGVTFCLKDNIAVKDVPMLIGTDVITDYVPNVDATLVTRLLESGATILGKAVCENLSLCASSFSAATGPVENPHAPGYTTGGSSSGCGSLIGAGVVEAGIGGDQGGSIRFPASYCGIVGMKPTGGLVPYTGLMTHDAVHDTTGPMTRTVELNARVLQAIAGRDGIDDRQYAAPLPAALPNYSGSLNSGVSGLKIGILREAFEFEVLDPRVKDLVLTAAHRFESLGAKVIQISIPIHKTAPDLVNVSLAFAASQQGYLGKACGRRALYLTELTEKMTPMTQDKFDKLFSMSKFTLLSGLHAWSQKPALYGKVMNLYRKLQDDYDRALTEVDVLITPTTPYVADRHPPSNIGPAEQMERSNGVAVNTMCFNASGHPALSIPIGRLPPLDNEGRDAGIKLPVGLQIVGKLFGEETVYRVGAAWERAFDWREM